MNLLAVDWDYFLPNPWRFEPKKAAKVPELMLYDWGHQEVTGSDLYRVGLWYTRASSFKQHDLPLPTLSGEQDTFWDRFDIDPQAVLWYADSNMHAYNNMVRDDVESVWLYDAHHDSGYRQGPEEMLKSGKVTCEDWMVAYYLDGIRDFHVRYPRWASPEADPEPKIEIDRCVDTIEVPSVRFDRVFVCRSDSWMPPWHDEDFTSFIEAAPVVNRRPLEPEAEGPRKFSMAQVEAEAELIKAMASGDMDLINKLADRLNQGVE